MNTLRNTSTQNNHLFLIIEEAKNKGAITQSRLGDLHEEINTLYRSQVRYFNHNTSSCISKNTYLRIWQTIDYLFCYGFAIRNENYLLLNEQNISFFFELGKNQAKQDCLQITNLLTQIKQTQLPYYNDRYRSIIHEQIKMYCKQTTGYLAHFYYCHHDDDLDYPLIDGLALYQNMYHKKGTQLVLEYTKRFLIENTICHLFQNEFAAFIAMYESCKGVSIEYLGLNILEVLLNQVIVNILLQHPISLFLKKEDVILLQNKYKQTNVELLIKNSLAYFVQALSKEQASYILTHSDLFIRNFYQIINNHYEILIYERKENEENTITLTMSNNNQRYLQMLHEIDLLFSTQDKINYIKTEVDSVYDVIDLLQSNVFYDDEYQSYFANLAAQEIAIFISVSLPHLNAFHTRVKLEEDLFVEMQQAEQWLTYLVDYLKGIPFERKQEIEHFLNHVKIK